MSDLRGEIRALHTPYADKYWYVPDCQGCDGDVGFDGGPAEWPCRTAHLVYTEQEIADRLAEYRAAYDAYRAAHPPAETPLDRLIPDIWTQQIADQISGSTWLERFDKSPTDGTVNFPIVGPGIKPQD